MTDSRRTGVAAMVAEWGAQAWLLFELMIEYVAIKIVEIGQKRVEN